VDRRLSYCQREDVHINCPVSCGVCCRDDPTYTFVTDYGIERDCAFIAENPWRVNTYCDTYNSGQMVRNACPATCDFCKSYISLGPSTSPSSSPSVTPSMAPSEYPSTTPSSAPSNNPTITCINNDNYVIDNDPIKTCKWVRLKNFRRVVQCKKRIVHVNCPVSCGVCCRDDPTYTLVTDGGFTKDCAWIAKQPNPRTKYCDTFNSGDMVRNACPATCNICKSYISLTPSNSPTTSWPTTSPPTSTFPTTSWPTTSPPTLTPTIICVNDDNFRVDGDSTKTCKWVRGKDYRRVVQCKKKDVHINCPVSCGVCCRDDPSYTLVTDGGFTKDCAWIVKQTDPRATKYCDTFNSGQMVRNACPSACSFCKSYVSLAPSMSL